MEDIYTKVPHLEYMRLLQTCSNLGKENENLKKEIASLKEKNATLAKEIVILKTPKTAEKAENKKGGNK